MAQRGVISGLAALATLGTAIPSEACIVMPPPQQIIADGLKYRTISKVAVVTITMAEPLKRIGSREPWSAEAIVDRVIRGSSNEKAISFDSGRGSAACEYEFPLPKKGDRWVAYFYAKDRDKQNFWMAYPLDFASRVSPWWIGYGN